MAKISARGARELARWERRSYTYAGAGNGTRDGAVDATVILTSDGRLLWKGSVAGDGWKVVARGYDLARAEQYADLRGYTRAAK